MLKKKFFEKNKGGGALWKVRKNVFFGKNDVFVADLADSANYNIFLAGTTFKLCPP